MGWADLVKIDIEGHERNVVLATKADDWQHLDAFIEISSADTASAIFDHLQAEGVNMFAQKLNWAPVARPTDVPTSYREGGLFVTMRGQMPWGSDN